MATIVRPSMKRFAVLALIAGFSTPALAETPEQKGLAVATKIDKANEGFKTDVSKVQMDLINRHQDRIRRTMTIDTVEGQTDGDKSKVEFLTPADVNGTKLLTWTHKKGDDDQWLYMPAIKRIKRISSRNKSGSFMGSEFAYEDMSSQEVEKYTYKYIKDAELEGRKVWMYERVPVDKRSGYTRQIVWADQEYMNALKVEYYDRKNELLKTATFKDYKKFGKFWRVGTIDMFNHQTKKRSTLVWKSRSLGDSLDDDDFESDVFGRLRH